MNTRHPKNKVTQINWEALAKSYEKTIQALSQQLETDPLTGVGNRHLLNNLVERREFKKSKGLCLVATIDMDHFKAVNDTLGHAAGDKLLKKAARLLSTCCREGEVMRLGGDEFCIVISDIASNDVPSMRLELENRLAKISERLPYSAELSYGISVGKTTHIRKLLKISDMMMYSHKSSKTAPKEEIAAA